jgi:hypothetical protein
MAKGDERTARGTVRTITDLARIAAEFDAAQDEMRKAAGYGTEGN